MKGGFGGNGCVSMLQIWANDKAGPDGGDGGNGAHVILQVGLCLVHKYSLKNLTCIFF